MPLTDRDAAHLWDLLETAKEVHTMMQRHGLESFLQDRVLRRALERCLEIVDEIARCVSDEVRQSIPGIEWKKIIGMRNVLAHEYGHIDHELLYDAAMQDIPRLIASLIVFQTQLENVMDAVAFETRAAEPELSLDELMKSLQKSPGKDHT